MTGNENGTDEKFGDARLNLSHQPLKALSSVYPQSTATRVVEDFSNVKTALLCVTTNGLQLVFRRIFLMIERHADVSRCW